MAMRASLLIDGDASRGKAALEAAATAARATKEEVKDLGTTATTAATAVDKLTTAEAKAVRETKALEVAQVEAAEGMQRASTGARTAAGNVIDLAEAQSRASREARELQQSQTMAAGSVANLTSQFNDVGMMLMAGQNPLMLAVQQGTQISQVIGPMGAAGAVKALGAAFVQMVSPVNLATLAIIAAGGYAVQWMTSTGEGAKSVSDRIEDLKSRIDDYATAASLARSPSAELDAQFGSMSEAIRKVLADMAELKRASTQDSLKGILDGLRSEIGIGDSPIRNWYYDGLALKKVIDGMDDATMKGILNAFEDLREDKTLPEMIEGVTTLRDRFTEAARASGGINSGENTSLTKINAVVEQLARLQGEDQNAKGLASARDLSDELIEQITLQRAITNFGESSAEVANLRLAAERKITEEMVKGLGVSEQRQAQMMAQWDAANPERDPFAERRAAAYRYYGETRRLSQEAEAEAQKLLASVSEENAIRAATLRYGEQSALVAELRADKERAVLEEQIDQLAVSEEIKNEIRAAIAAGEQLGATDMSTGISAAADEARRVADEILRAIGATRSLQQTGAEAIEDARIRSETALDPIAQARRLGEARMRRTQGVRRDGAEGMELEALDAEVRAYGEGEAERATLDQQTRDAISADRRGRKGARGAADKAAREAERDQDRIDDLIGGLRDEIDAMRELDPIQQEMIRHREVLAKATDKERETVEELIRQRNAEAIATETLRDATDLAGDSMYDFLDGIILRGASAASVIADLAGTLADAVLKSALLGEGPLAGILGTATGGGIFGLALSSLGLGAHAEGGLIAGPGTGTSDSILARLSNGEYVINAAATAKHRPLIEAINEDRLGAFASGGMVGQLAAPSWMRPTASTPTASTSGTAVLEIRLPEGMTADLEGQMEGVAIRVVQASLGEFSRKVLPDQVKRITSKPRFG